MEVALEAICSYLDARTTELESAAYPALDELTKKVGQHVFGLPHCLGVVLRILIRCCTPDLQYTLPLFGEIVS